MTTTNWIILVAGALIAVGISWFTYFRREPLGRGRHLLMAMRAATLILIILLLIDPRFGVSARHPRDHTRVILDASLSMLPRASDTTAWRAAIREARRHGNAGVIIGGAVPRTIAPDSLATLQPSTNSSQMLPAIVSAAEGGAQRVIVVTDGAVEDAAEIRRWLPRLGIDMDVKRIETASFANRAIAELDAPQWAEAGKPLQIRVGVVARALPTSSAATIVVRQNGNVVARNPIQPPVEGRIVSVTISFNAVGPANGGLVRYDVGFETPDSVPDDDVRSAYVFVSEKPAGVAIVSFLPDWEPKFLHPVLGQALGLPVRTFLRVPNGSYFRGGDGLEAGSRVGEDVVRSAIAQADLVVLHGVTESAPQWWRQIATTTRRLIIFPADALGEPFEVGTAAAADWYVAPEIPASPVAAFMQNLDMSELPPLESIFSATYAPGAWTPLQAGRNRRGGRSPVLMAYESAGRRVAVALASGYWRWSFRGGVSRELYTRLWGSLAGWIVQDEAQVAGAAVRPVKRALQRGQAVRWIAPGLPLDSLQVHITDNAGRMVQRSTVPQQRADTAYTAPLAPGHYQYVARAFAEGAEVANANGPLTVETYSAEFMRASADLNEARSGPGTLVDTNRSAGRPLHASAWPYVVLVLLLCGEWILRRRWGLR